MKKNTKPREHRVGWYEVAGALATTKQGMTLRQLAEGLDAYPGHIYNILNHMRASGMAKKGKQDDSGVRTATLYEITEYGQKRLKAPERLPTCSMCDEPADVKCLHCRQVICRGHFGKHMDVKHPEKL